MVLTSFKKWRGFVRKQKHEWCNDKHLNHSETSFCVPFSMVAHWLVLSVELWIGHLLQLPLPSLVHMFCLSRSSERFPLDYWRNYGFCVHRTNKKPAWFLNVHLLCWDDRVLKPNKPGQWVLETWNPLFPLFFCWDSAQCKKTLFVILGDWVYKQLSIYTPPTVSWTRNTKQKKKKEMDQPSLVSPGRTCLQLYSFVVIASVRYYFHNFGSFVRSGIVLYG